MDKMREEFEAWWNPRKEVMESQGAPLIRIIKDHNKYWLAWQASRKALVVTLPEVCAFNLCDLLDKKEVIEHIRAAGITVKGEGDEQTNVLSPE